MTNKHTKTNNKTNNNTHKLNLASKQTNKNKLEQADQTAKQVKSLYNRAVAKTCEGSRAADELLHHHTYKTLATGMLVGMVTGYFLAQKCRCCSR